MRQTRGIYLISMVAKTLEMHPQTLRKYERAGFIEPLRMGTLRTYSDEDVARLRLIKHLVDELGLKLSGVEMALSFANHLLEVRIRLSQAPDPPKAVADSIRQIDDMLATVGVRVVKRVEREYDAHQRALGDGGFKVNPGEMIEFRVPTQAPGGAQGRGYE